MVDIYPGFVESCTTCSGFVSRTVYGTGQSFTLLAMNRERWTLVMEVVRTLSAIVGMGVNLYVLLRLVGKI